MTYKLRRFQMVFNFVCVCVCLSLLVLEKLENSIFVIPIIPQILNINNCISLESLLDTL